jgi:hypothetical protein
LFSNLVWGYTVTLRPEEIAFVMEMSIDSSGFEKIGVQKCITPAQEDSRLYRTPLILPFSLGHLWTIKKE